MSSLMKRIRVEILAAFHEVEIALDFSLVPQALLQAAACPGTPA